jgi:hypothetical protein
MNLEDEFNDFIVSDLIDSSSFNNENNFYFDTANIIAEGFIVALSLDMALWMVQDFHGTTYYIKIISRITLYLV